MLRVLLFEAYSGKATGNLRYLLDLAQHGPASGLELQIVVPRDFALLSEARAAGARCLVVAPPARLLSYGGAILREGVVGRALTFSAMLRYWRRIRSAVKELQPDVLLANSLRSYALAAPAARSVGVPTVFYVTGETESIALGRLATRLADRVLFQSERTVDARLLPRPQDRTKVRIVPNGTDLGRVATMAERGCDDLRKERGEFWITCVGTLSPLKGLVPLLDAFTAIAGRDQRLRLILVGDAARDVDQPFAAALRERVEREGLSDKVRFLGWRDDAPAVVAMSDLVVHPSLSEGMPKAVIEAMMVGRAVVASAVGGIPDFVQDRITGLLVEPGDAAALARSLLELATDDDRRRAMEAAAKVFARQRTIQANVQLLADVLGEASSRRRRRVPSLP